MNFEWALVLGSIGILVLGVASYYLTTSAKYLTIREYETYNQFMIREIDKLGNQILVLEQTRPTTGELEARFYRISNDHAQGS